MPKLSGTADMQKLMKESGARVQAFVESDTVVGAKRKQHAYESSQRKLTKMNDMFQVNQGVDELAAVLGMSLVGNQGILLHFATSATNIMDQVSGSSPPGVSNGYTAVQKVSLRQQNTASGTRARGWERRG